MSGKKSNENQLPKYVYKYRAIDKNTITNLVNGTIYFADPRFANDPSEVAFNKETSDKNMEGLIDFLHNKHNILGEDLLKWIINGKTGESRLNKEKNEEARKELKKLDKDFCLSEKSKETRKYFIKYFFDNLFPIIQESSRIFCCSENLDIKHKLIDDNLLMWSHYADSHKGLCIEYELSDDEFTLQKANQGYLSYLSNDRSIQLDKVEYEKDLPILWDNEGEIDHYNLFYSKFPCWTYENEWRFVIPQKSFDLSNDNGNILFTNCFKKISSIIFGEKSTKEDQDMIINICKNCIKGGLPEFKIAIFDEETSFLKIINLEKHRRNEEHFYPSE